VQGEHGGLAGLVIKALISAVIGAAVDLTARDVVRGSGVLKTVKVSFYEKAWEKGERRDIELLLPEAQANEVAQGVEQLRKQAAADREQAQPHWKVPFRTRQPQPQPLPAAAADDDDGTAAAGFMDVAGSASMGPANVTSVVYPATHTAAIGYAACPRLQDKLAASAARAAINVAGSVYEAKAKLDNSKVGLALGNFGVAEAERVEATVRSYEAGCDPTMPHAPPRSLPCIHLHAHAHTRARARTLGPAAHA
jgi:hypothetical protein